MFLGCGSACQPILAALQFHLAHPTHLLQLSLTSFFLCVIFAMSAVSNTITMKNSHWARKQTFKIELTILVSLS